MPGEVTPQGGREKAEPALGGTENPVWSSHSSASWGANLTHGALQSVRPHLPVGLIGLPGGAVVKNPPSTARDTGSIPGQGARIPHVSE